MNKHDITRDSCQLFGPQARHGYDWWWTSFTGHHTITGAERSFFIEFFAVNPAYGTEEPVFGQASAEAVPSYVMVKCGTWGSEKCQLHRFFGWKKVQVDMGVPFSVKAGDCFMSETETRGSVRVKQSEEHPEWMCDNGEMTWHLKIDKQIAFHVGYGASRLFRKLQLFEMFWHAEGMKTCFDGEVVFNGETYRVDPETCFGYADKNWGRNFTSPWVWLSSCDLTSLISGKKLENSVFDIGGGCPKIGPLALKRKLLADFYYEGEDYEFNFSRFWHGTRTAFDCRETDTQIIWHVEQKTWRTRMVTDITCEKKDMLWVNYEAPDGTRRHGRLWNGGNGVGTVELWKNGRLVDRVRAEHVGCEYGEYTV